MYTPLTIDNVIAKTSVLEDAINNEFWSSLSLNEHYKLKTIVALYWSLCHGRSLEDEHTSIIIVTLHLLLIE